MADRVAVVGAGLMGVGIAQALAQAGVTVALHDIDAGVLGSGMARIDVALQRAEAGGRLDSAKEVFARLEAHSDLAAAVEGSSVVIEAVPEQLDLKRELFARLDQLTGPATVLATNTSGLSITAIARATTCPERVVGMHWFNPAPVMRLVEVVRGVDTTDETVEAVVALAGQAGKECIVCRRDTQGFVTSRVGVAYWMETIRILEEGLASAEEIDLSMRLAYNYPMGPFELADYVGLDTLLATAQGLTEAYGDRFRPPQMLVKLVTAGHLGRKTGRGFYTHPDDKAAPG